MAVAGGRPSAAPAPDTTIDDQLRRARLSVIVGGSLAERRRQVARGERPRIDVLEMESRFGASILDLSSLDSGGPKARLLRLVARRTGLWSFCLAFLCLSRVRHDDVVYATGEDVGFPLAVLMRLFRVRRPKLIVRLEQPTYGRTALRRTLYSAFMEAALTRVHRTITRTMAHAHYLGGSFRLDGRSSGRIPEEPLAYVSETTDPAFFDPGLGTRGRGGNGASAQPLIVSGGLEMRDYDTLIEAVRGLPLRLVIGAGSPWSHEAFSGGDDLPENVTVSSFTPVQMRELYRSAAFVVVPVKPTLRACGMNVILEAWAMEKAVVASRTVGLLGSVREGEAALLVEPGDVEALRAAIEGLLKRPKEARRLGRNGRRIVLSELNLDRYLDRIGDHLVAALDAPV